MLRPLILLLLGTACGGRSPREVPAANLAVPAWSGDVIWYQIFVERFRNGDPTNDPTPHDIEGVTDQAPPRGWRPTPWSQDWYRQEPWAKATGKDFYATVQFRRYGGDLQGVMDRLDYLQELGVTALYLNPVNDAPSLHKYDARNYHHIDRNFGPDPRGDEACIAAEDPVDPATWNWTAADSLFLALVREVHRRGMRIIMDYSWNHTGITFWAWRDVLAKQRASRFADWYAIERFDDPTTAGHQRVPVPRMGRGALAAGVEEGRPPAGQDPRADRGQSGARRADQVFEVTRRWLDPNGDGDPSDGVDGFRLDVAEMVPLGFWRDYRRFVRSINPEAYLVGEVWWEQWPDTHVRSGAVAPGRRVRRGDELPLVHADARASSRRAAGPHSLDVRGRPRLARHRHRTGAHAGDDEPDGEPRHAALQHLDLQPGTLQVPQLPARGPRLPDRPARRSHPPDPAR